MRKPPIKCHFNVVTRSPDGLISISKAPRLNDNGSSNTQVAIKTKNTAEAKLRPKSEISDGKVIIDLPLRTKSEANCFEPWQVKHKRHKNQQNLITLALKPLKDKIKLPCKITFTRLAPNTLDKHDNLPMSFKYIVDAVCSILTGNYVSGRADDDERIEIYYDQIKSKEYGIRIETYSK